jgi:hypothetical protein
MNHSVKEVTRRDFKAYALESVNIHVMCVLNLSARKVMCGDISANRVGSFDTYVMCVINYSVNGKV